MKSQRAGGLRKVSLRLGLTIILGFMLLAPGVSATAPYNSYTYDWWAQPVESPMYYVPEASLLGEDVGIGAFSDPSDVAVCGDEIYVLDTGNNRIAVFNGRYELVRVIDSFENQGIPDGFSSPKGICVTEDGEIYVADTGNGRIVHLAADGELQAVYGRPETDLLDEGVPYQPARLAVDTASGRMYVQAVSVNLGLLELDADGTFLDFFGANKVKVNMAEYIWRYFSTEEQLAATALFLPTEYTSLTLDGQNFVYVTSSTSEQKVIKRLNPRGNDVLVRNGYVDPLGDYTETGDSASSFTDIAVHESGIYSALDSNTGRVFCYDTDGNLLVAFGAKDYREGNVQVPRAIEYYGDKLLIAEGVLNKVMVYDLTEYGSSVQAAISLYERGEYDQSAQQWNTVLQYNANSDLAYTGLGKVALQNEEYKKAVEYFRLSQNRTYYSKAYKAYRQEMLTKWFPYVGTVLVIGGGALVIWSLYKKGRRIWERLCAGYETV